MTPYLEITETEMLDIIDKCNDNENAYKECIIILYGSFYHLTLFGSTNKLILGSMIYNRIILNNNRRFEMAIAKPSSSRLSDFNKIPLCRI